MSLGRGRWWLALAAIALALLQIPVVLKTATDPSQSDFGNYFAPAFVLAQGSDLGELYDRENFATAMGRAGLSVLGSFIPHPPANALWLFPMAGLGPARGKGVWTVVLLLSMAATIVLTKRVLPRPDGWLAGVIVLAPFLAVRNNLAFGQPYLVLSALLVSGCVALLGGSQFAAGFLLGLGVSFKPYALCVGLLFLHRERLRSLAGFVCGAVLPSLIIVALDGTRAFTVFAAQIVPWMVRGDIQDPFSPVWGSIGALANRLFRFEPDLNPAPWLVAPLLARFIGAAVPVSLIALAVWCGRTAMREGRQVDAVSICVAFALAASPFAATYHLVLLSLPVAAVASRLQGTWQLAWVAGWFAIGSPLMNAFRDLTGALAPLAYSRFFLLAAGAFLVARPYLHRAQVIPVVGVGFLAGGIAIMSIPREELWPRVAKTREYSMMKPHFCGAELRWLAPSSDGRRLERRGGGEDCGVEVRERSGAAVVTSRFAEGSFNLYLTGLAPAAPTRISSSDANEVDPTFTPDGCGIVFASDQGRGLGSTALYRIDVSRFIEGCGTVGLAEGPR